MTIKYWVDQNKCWSDWYQGDWPECEETEDFFEALCIFLEICNTYLDECYDDDWDGGQWRKMVEGFCERNGKEAEESFSDFLKRETSIDSTGTVYVTLESSDECLLEFYAEYDADAGIWRASGLIVGDGSFELFKKDYQYLLAGVDENKSKKLESLWRLNQL